MNREHHKWHSPSLNCAMEILAYGHAGFRVIAFPTSMGRFYDWEDRGLVGAIADWIDAGKLQLFCVDSVDRESWYASDRSPADRALRHVQFDRYVETEVVPFTRQRNGDPTLVVTGASFGGYHAVNFGLRHPALVNRILSMSGLCDIRRFTDDYYDDNVYFNNPCDFVANDCGDGRLAALRDLDIILAVGRDDPLCASNETLSRMLWGKNVWHALRIWDGFAHDWPCWKDMLRLYLCGHD